MQNNKYIGYFTLFALILNELLGIAYNDVVGISDLTNHYEPNNLTILIAGVVLKFLFIGFTCFLNSRSKIIDTIKPESTNFYFYQ